MTAVSPIRLLVREARLAKGLTLEALAEKAGIRKQTVIEMEKGRTKGIDFATLEAIANALEMDAALLIKHERGR